MSRRRVVITGLGAMTPVGLDLESTWANLLAGKSGAAPVERFDVTDHPTKFACEIKGFDAEKHFSRPEARKLDTYAQILLVAADAAMASSGLRMDREDPARCGCILGTGIGGIHELEATKMLFMERGPSRISPFFIPKMMS